MLTYDILGSVFLNIMNALLCAFWMGVLVFTIFILYMTFVTIKTRDMREKNLEKKKLYKKNYQCIFYSIPLLIGIFISFALTIF